MAGGVNSLKEASRGGDEDDEGRWARVHVHCMGARLYVRVQRVHVDTDLFSFLRRPQPLLPPSSPMRKTTDLRLISNPNPEPNPEP